MAFPLLALLPSLLEIGSKVIDRVVPDKEAAEKAKREMAAEIQSQEFALNLAQVEVNKEEAKSESIFVAGWRPFVGWVGAFGFGYACIADPMMRFVASVIFGYQGTYPLIDSNLTMQVLFGILGLGAMRSYDKLKGNGSEVGKH